MKLKYLLPSLLLLTMSAFGQNTQLTGTFKNGDGTGFNGTLYLSISQVAGVSPNGSCGGPVQVVPNASLIISLVNGAMSSYQVQGSTAIISGAPKVYGSDCTLPSGVPYVAQLKDPQGNTAFNQLWLLIGSTQDIGTVTSNVPNPQALYLSVIPALGAPSGICSNTQVYLQTDATPGINTWWCTNGTWTQQVGSGGGGGGGGVTIGNAVVGGTSGSTLFVDASTNLAQDNANYRYDPIAHQLNLTNLAVTNNIIGSVTGSSATSTTATALASAPTNCSITNPGTAATGITATGAPSSCIGIISPVGATNEVQAKAASGGLEGSGLIANGTTVTGLVPIILAADPITALGAATKQYVDAAVAGFTGAIVQNPTGSQTIQQPDGTTFNIINAGVTTGVLFQLGAHVNLSVQGGTVSMVSPDSASSIGLTDAGIALSPSTSAYLTLGGRLVVSSINLTTSTTIGANGEYADLVNAASGALTETLPLAATATTGRQTFVVIKTDASTNHVTVAAGSGDTVDGASTTVLSGQYSAVTLLSDGIHNWTVTAGFASSGLLLQTNSINNPIQTVENLVNGPGINITNDTATGKTQITNTYATNPTPLGVSQNVDWPPSITTAMNDEFTDAVFNTSNIWTVVNQGSDTVVNKNSLLSINAVAHSGDNFVGIYQLTPATPFAVTAKITLTGLNVSGYYGGLAFRDSSTGKVVSLRIGNGSTLTVDHWASPTTLTSSVYTQTVDSTATIYMTLKDDGTNYTFSFSRDGVNFIPVYSENRTAFLASPDTVGYMTGSSNATYPMELGSDWFRRTL